MSTTMTTATADGGSIERFYDNETHEWVCMLKDEAGNQTAHAIFVGDKRAALAVHERDFQRFVGGVA